MNHIDAVQSLAAYNAKACHPKREEEVDKTIPYFCIKRNQLGALDVEGFAFENHDNAPRMIGWIEYLKRNIIPNVRNKTGVCGYYNIELHDSYTYLENGKNYKDCFTFSKFKNDPGCVLIPDPYMMYNWGNSLATVSDNLPFEKKSNIVSFYGTTTGHRNPSQNQRIQICAWAKENPFFNMKITKVAQMTEDSIINSIGLSTWKDIYQPSPVSYADQMKNKFHLVVDGNTCRFDVWNYKTNCLTFKYDSSEMLWYYPMLRHYEHFVEVHKDNLEFQRNFYINNVNDAHRIIRNANILANELFKPMTHMMYTTALFETISENQ